MADNLLVIQQRLTKAAGYYRYEYDHLNRVTAVTNDQGTPVAEYAYDALNRRIEKVDKTGQSNVTYTYYYTPGWQLLEVYKDGDADVYERYLWGGQYIDELIRRERDSNTNGSVDETHFAGQDGNWNVTALINADGTVAERYLYDAYGTPTVLDADWSVDANGISDVANPILYAGYFFDSETASFDVRNRYLHTGLGRWMSRDPMGYVDSASLYEYLRSMPTLYADPFGTVIPGEDAHADYLLVLLLSQSFHMGTLYDQPANVSNAYYSLAAAVRSVGCVWSLGLLGYPAVYNDILNVISLNINYTLGEGTAVHEAVHALDDLSDWHITPISDYEAAEGDIVKSCGLILFQAAISLMPSTN